MNLERMTVMELCEKLEISFPALMRLRAKGMPEKKMLGIRKSYFNYSEVMAWLEQLEKKNKKKEA
jgi:predicted DNA-binding transcriptional regulator AlpA